ncbi:arginase family protein [Arthrobacter globiformis]|uniref:arginase family protein n=1 Tax=Arthrobacter globiformis TaxID=1665 RepID=UPI0027814A05|nr:arginase family protein [Arthrobacter globiformis]MDQ0867302.1 arginase [Arthrobacter globiformis]
MLDAPLHSADRKKDATLMVTAEHPDPEESKTLRLLWPQWQGAAPQTVAELVPELPLHAAQTGYSLGSSILNALLPTGGGTTVHVPVSEQNGDTDPQGGIIARQLVLAQLREAVSLIEQAQPEKIVTLGGECSVSIAPFAYLAEKYGDDMAVVWLDAHADCTLPSDPYDAYHAMALAHLTGHGDSEFIDALPATVNASNAAIAGVHAWTDWDRPNAHAWGIESFSAQQLNDDTEPLLSWLKATGCSRVAVHLDLDVVDSNEIIFGLGMEPNGLSRTALIRTLTELSQVADLVAVTVAEYVPRQVIAVRELLASLPLP